MLVRPTGFRRFERASRGFATLRVPLTRGGQMRRAIYLAAAALIGAAPLQAQGGGTILWGNNAQGGGPARIEKFDKNTGALLDTFSGAPGNGRGVVVVGNV